MSKHCKADELPCSAPCYFCESLFLPRGCEWVNVLLVPAHPDSPGQRAVVCVCFQVIVYLRSVLTENVDARSELQ